MATVTNRRAQDRNDTLYEAVGRLVSARVLVIGDLMLDRNVLGRVERVSPEAPVPVLQVEREDAVPGGAANVARNVSALGAQVTLIGVVGRDEGGRELIRQVEALPQASALPVIDPERPTTVKTRYRAGGQQLLRSDRESAAPIGERAASMVIGAVEDAVADAQVIVLSDYAKGLLTDEVLRAVFAAAAKRDVPVLVDPKSREFSRYRGARLITPNRGELRAASGLACDTLASVEQAARRVAQSAGVGAVLATLSQDGMMLVEGKIALHIPSLAREVYDVSGAGDTAMATLAAAIGSGAEAATAARLANLAAGVVVGRVGTATAHADDLLAELAQGGAGKIIGLEAAKDRVGAWRRQGMRIGFTNGCFDLIHPGHVALLDGARAACDRLVVGLNTDASVKRLKGPQRPIQDEGARATVLASLAPVDLVVLFAEDTPMAVIEALRPDVLIKGADYKRAEVVGGDFIEGYGGKVVLAPILAGHSTTGTIGRMAKGKSA